MRFHFGNKITLDSYLVTILLNVFPGLIYDPPKLSRFPASSNSCVIGAGRHTRSIEIKKALFVLPRIFACIISMHDIAKYVFYCWIRESARRGFPVKYLRHPDTIALATLGSFHIYSSQFSFRDTISREFERNITRLHGESSPREYICTRVILARNSWVLSGFFSVSMVTHVGRTKTWRAYHDVCDKVTFSLFLRLDSQTHARNFTSNFCTTSSFVLFPNDMVIDHFCRFATLINHIS